jgi:hypothetical protein
LDTPFVVQRLTNGDDVAGNEWCSCVIRHLQVRQALGRSKFKGYTLAVLIDVNAVPVAVTKATFSRAMICASLKSKVTGLSRHKKNVHIGI